MEQVNIISSDHNGAELRRWQRQHLYTRCDGKDDQHQINEALARTQRDVWSINGEAWERIFGGN